MPIFFAEREEGGLALLSREDSHHALRVLRLRPGSAVQAAVAGRRFAGELTEQGGLAAVRLAEELPSTESPLKVTLYQGLPKGDKLESVIRAATELGASAIVPCLFSRCVARPEAAEGERKRERLVKIAREAAMLSFRTLLPEIGELLSFDALCGRLGQHQAALVPWEEAGGAALPARPVSLGPRILRTESAGAAAIAMLTARAVGA